MYLRVLSNAHIYSRGKKVQPLNTVIYEKNYNRPLIYVMAAICMQFQAILPAQKYSNFYINSRAMQAVCVQDCMDQLGYYLLGCTDVNSK